VKRREEESTVVSLERQGCQQPVLAMGERRKEKERNKRRKRGILCNIEW
jgi:hypothetical protein